MTVRQKTLRLTLFVTPQIILFLGSKIIFFAINFALIPYYILILPLLKYSLAPRVPVIVLDDIDAIFENKEMKEKYEM